MLRTNHLTKGSQLPPLEKDVLRLYNTIFCPFAHKVLLTLHEKGIKYDVVNVNTVSKPEWFVKLAPLGLIPVIQQGDNMLCESLVIMEFLNERYPDPPLYPQDTWTKFKDRMLMDLFSSQVTVHLKNLFYIANVPMAEVQLLMKNFFKGLDFLEKELVKRGTPFFYGQTPGILDFFMWPIFERLPAVNEFGYNGSIDADRFPSMTRFIENMIQNSTVKSVYHNPKQHAAFMKSVQYGKMPDFDMVL